MMHDHNTTRRGMLGAIAGVPLAASFGAIAFAPASASLRAWDAAVRHHEIARANLTRACEANDAAYERYYDARGTLPKEPNGLHILVGDTVESGTVRHRAAMDLAKSADRECQEKCGIQSTERVLDEISAAEEAALLVLFETPAPHLPAVIMKLDMVDDGVTDKLHYAIADLRRLAAEGR